MTKMIELSEKALRVRGLFPADCVTGTWYPLQNGFYGMLLPNGSVDIRHKVKLLEGDDSHVWRIDRVTPKGNERFLGYQPMTTIESQIY
jgi:hypothetical protein